MDWKKILERFPVIKDISTLSVAHIIPTIIAAGFWFYIASLVGDEIYGEIIYYLTIAGIASGITMLGAPSALNVYAAKGERILPTLSAITFTISAIGAVTVFFILIYENSEIVF